MRHATNLTFGEMKVGDEFQYTTCSREDYGKKVEETAEVEGITKTKAGRIRLFVKNKGMWTNGPASPTSVLQTK